mmetsp:Transcript_20800/g.24030  ORF Transcript_20800/g.24030 Transcript_20800/m.24030 type:complete len:135 (+) Transcript_20800:50-454(+)
MSSQKPHTKGLLKFKGNVTSKDLINKLNASNKKLSKIAKEEEEEEEKRTKQQEESYEPKLHKVVKVDNDKSTLVDSYGNRQTEYEKKVSLLREKRMNDRLKKELGTSFRAKMEGFNKTLSKIPEHYDIPKVGPG